FGDPFEKVEGGKLIAPLQFPDVSIISLWGKASGKLFLG
ncbi:unnamed protein product, partial [marine sediment metagenome]